MADVLGSSAARACLRGAEWEQKSHGGPSLFPKHSPQKLGYVIFIIFLGSVINIFFFLLHQRNGSSEMLKN